MKQLANILSSVPTTVLVSVPSLSVAIWGGMRLLAVLNENGLGELAK